MSWAAERRVPELSKVDAKHAMNLSGSKSPDGNAALPPLEMQMNRKNPLCRLVAIVSIASLALVATARAHEGHHHDAMGTVKAVDAATLSLETQEGKLMSFDLSGATTYKRGTAAATHHDVAVGDRAVVMYEKKGEKNVAVEVKLGAAKSAAKEAAVGYDLGFIDTMSKHHRGAMEMAAMAQMKLEHAGLKALAKEIPVAQQKEISQMKSWRDSWYPGAPVAADTSSSGMNPGMDMDHMKAMKAGRDYDVMFIDMMVPHHESAVKMSKAALASAEHPEVKKLAQQIIDMQAKEIDQMKKWKAELAGGGTAH